MYKVEENVAIADFREFYAQHNLRPIEDEKILETYPNVIEAIKTGSLTFNDGTPIFELSKPISNDNGDLALDKVSFKTRILPSEQRAVSKGLDVAKDKLLFIHKCYAFIIGQPVQMLDKFYKNDYAVVEQLSTLFI